MRAAPILLLLLAACAGPDLDAPGADEAERAESPTLLPFAELLAPPSVPREEPGAFAPDLADRTAALRARAAGLPRVDAGNGPALESRLGELRGRAETVRARGDAGGTPQERERL